MKGLLRQALAGALCSALLLPTLSAHADYEWVPGNSTYGDSNTPFVAGQISGTGATQGSPMAFGGGFNVSGDLFIFGLVNSIPTTEISFGISDLSSTVLTAGTKVVLEFSKEASDNLNWVALVAQANASESDSFTDPVVEIVSDTQVRVTAYVVDPVGSAAGDAGAAFGLVISYGSTSRLDFDGATFVTNAHYLDVANPNDALSGTAGINISGTEGVETTCCAFLPSSLLSDLSISDPEQVVGYIDGLPVDSSKFTNFGELSDSGFSYSENGVVPTKICLSNDDWSAKDVQFGVSNSQGSGSETPKGDVEDDYVDSLNSLNSLADAICASRAGYKKFNKVLKKLVTFAKLTARLPNDSGEGEVDLSSLLTLTRSLQSELEDICNAAPDENVDISAQLDSLIEDFGTIVTNFQGLAEDACSKSKQKKLFKRAFQAMKQALKLLIRASGSENKAEFKSDIQTFLQGDFKSTKSGANQGCNNN